MTIIKDALQKPDGTPDFEAGAFAEIRLPWRNAGAAATGTDAVLPISITAAGLETPQLQPGRAVIYLKLGELREGVRYAGVIPAGTGTIRLWEFIAAGVQIPPDTPADVIKSVFDAWLSGGVGAALNDPAGKELAVAEARSQFNYGGDWNNVPGMQFTLTTETPAYLSINLGTCVLATTTKETMEQRILDQDTATVIAYSTSTIAGDPSGFDSIYMPVISGRVPGGITNRTYVVQVKSSSGKAAYITPSWLAGAASSLYAIGA